MSIEFLCLDNLASNTVARKKPWELDPEKDFNYPASGFSSGKAYKDWAARQETLYCCWSLCEGEFSTDRVGSKNMPCLIHGIAADYDTEVPFDADDEKLFLERSRNTKYTPYAPMWLSRSQGDGFHAAWIFETPVPCLGMVNAREFLAKAKKELKLCNLSPGLDTKAAVQPEKYYLYGKSWQRVSDTVIPSGISHLWMHESSTPRTFKDFGVKIPLEFIRRKMDDFYPGHNWPGEFREGARGPTFWEPNAGHTSTNAAVVHPNGMQCFNSIENRGFFGWAEVFEPQFVQEFQASRMGTAVANFWYDGIKFWERLDCGRVVGWSREDSKVRLKTKHLLSSTTPRNGTSSEIDRAMNTIFETKMVEGAMPFVFDKREIVTFQNKKYINTSVRKVIQPADEPQDWCENFAFTGALLQGLLGDEQLKYWLAWASRFYRASFSGKPEPGHAMFLIGPPGIGKTFLSENTLDILFGGISSCGSFLMGEDSGFNSRHFEFGVWTCDDRVPASDLKKFQHYCSMVKSIVANSVHGVNEKFLKAAQLQWLGRLVVMANMTPEDIRMIPELSTGMLDKLLVFKALQHEVEFGDKAENRRVCEEEMPFLARYLLDYEPPEEILGKARFGIKGYVNKDIEEFVLAEGGVHAYFLELMDFFRDKHFSKDDGTRTTWVGNATELMAEIDGLSPGNHVLKDVTVTRLGRSLSNFAERSGVPWLTKNPSRKYVIKSPFVEEGQ